MGITRQVEIPPGVNVTLEGSMLTVSGPKGTLVRDIRFPQIDVTVGDGEVVVSTASDKKRFLAMSGTLEAHVKSMFRGVVEGYEYRMKVVYSHFPIQLKQQGDRLEINNFLGEKQPRLAKILKGVTVKIGNDEVTLTGIDKEKVGNTAANIEHATRVTKRDPRVFQDGVYITERA
ncbi:MULTISPECIES: 50S ribosomal protein L6 [unclassified Methanoculleus]|uniref:50S ribosomal protein L6 n=1 Tax=unclassified Methanoculleus TaxID=2619537 RepID=UPI0025ECF006|nr:MULTISPECIES: 50S ribosomal protein L6 [unclassified Methanoculleus]MCK9318608.1 50S ribosomal protein L6 [Methanoculleus sp.]MDD2254162.1 50S ribosomal protein L6 [Methanoculleus sp.]MDD2787059.1 50S ribosomal protein L6 [Methanoculleus sp.]MDD3216640.1 50S ribosomal protein L6 [Methanoculleus sp.]MDD4314735.1 50S ribosomal protein L6 [Methanoculleus sp.]